MVEVAKELVETMNSRQELVPVAKMILAELTSRVTQGLQKICDSGVFRLKAEFRARQAYLGQPGTDRRLSRDEGGPTGCTALLAIPVGEHRAFFGDSIDVRRAVAHDSMVVGTDIEPANIISPDDQYIWFSRHAVLPFNYQVMLFGLRLSEIFYCLRIALNKARMPSNAKNAAITPASDGGRPGQRSCNIFEARRCW